MKKKKLKKAVFFVYLLFKRQLKNPAILVFLIAVPIATAIMSNVSVLNKSDIPRVGIVLEDNDAVAEKMVNILKDGDYAVEFFTVESAEALEKTIKNGKAECGYIIEPGLKEKLDKEDFKGCIERIINDSAFISSMTDEILFSAMFKAYAVEVAVNYIDGVEEFDNYKEICEKTMREDFENYLTGDETFKLSFKMLDDTEEGGITELKEGNKFPLKAILAILVYIAGLFGIVQYYMDKESGTFVTMSAGYRVAGKPLYALVGCFTFAVSAILAMIIAGDMGKTGAGIFIIRWLIYVAAVTLFSWLVAIIIRSSKAMISLILVLLIACLILCPVFVNITGYVPAARIMQRLLLPYYMM